jgi:hypothetical protein
MPSFSHNIPNMDDPRLTRPWLESLCTEELVKLADGLGIDIPFGLERIFIIEELLDFACSNELPREEEPEFRSDFLEAAVLPKQYNISYIEVMIRDPLWAFVFWEIKGHDREAYEKAADFGGYCLRVVPLQKAAAIADTGGGENPFTVGVGVNDSAWYLGFPPAGGRYRVELCAARGESLAPLTASRPFELPRLIEPPKADGEPYQNPLSCLSGIRDFSVIQSLDRRSRAKGK